MFLDSNYRKTIPQHYQNILDYLTITRDINNGSWDSNPVKTSNCFKALKSISKIDEDQKTENWIKEWLENIDSFDKSDPKDRKDLKIYIEGVGKSVEVLEADKIPEKKVKAFLEETRMKKGAKSGSWLGDIYLTALSTHTLNCLGFSAPETTKKWLKDREIDSISIRELTALYNYAPKEIDSDKIESELKTRVSDPKELSDKELLAILGTGIKWDQSYYGELEERLENINNLHINAGLTKALWQASILKSASFTGKDISQKFDSLENRYWLEYIDEIDDEKIILNLEDQINSIVNSKKNIDFLAESLIVLNNQKRVICRQIPEKDFKNLTKSEKMKKRREEFKKPIIADRTATTALGISSAALLYLYANQIGLTEDFLIDKIIIIASLFLAATGYYGNILGGINASIRKLKEIAGIKETREHLR